jgi:hypothetical protein
MFNCPFDRSPKAAGMRYDPGDLRASDQGLGRNARYVDAGPAYHSGLDHGDAPASLGLNHRQCLGRFSTAEDKDIEVFNGDHGPLPFEGCCHCNFLRSPHGYLNVGQARLRHEGRRGWLGLR